MRWTKKARRVEPTQHVESNNIKRPRKSYNFASIYKDHWASEGPYDVKIKTLFKFNFQAAIPLFQQRLLIPNPKSQTPSFIFGGHMKDFSDTISHDDFFSFTSSVSLPTP